MTIALISSVALLCTIGIVLGIFVVKTILGGLAVLLLVAVGFLVAVRLFTSMFVHTAVVSVMSIVLLLAEARVSAVRLIMAAVALAMFTVNSSEAVDILA